MILNIFGVPETFRIDSLIIKGDHITLDSGSLVAHIKQLKDQISALQPAKPEEPPKPPAPVEVEYVGTDKLGNYTVEQYRATHWTTPQLLEAGYIVAKKVEPEVMEPPKPPADIPPVPDKKIPPPVPPVVEAETYKFEGKQYKLAPKMAGASVKQFLDMGWEYSDLIREEYFIFADGTMQTPESPRNAPWPRKNEAGGYVDSAGTLFDEVRHGMSKDLVPAVTVKGVFKKKKGYKPTPEAPATPAAEPSAPDAPAAPASLDVPSAPAAPSAPEASQAPSAPTLGDEPLDDELEDLIKGW